jgi:hypothetical protein
LQFAKVREEQGQFVEAAAEYERGGDAEAAVRLLLQVNNVNKAFGIARRSGSTTAATLIAKHCSQHSNWAGTVEFSILSGDYTTAWQVYNCATQVPLEMSVKASHRLVSPTSQTGLTCTTICI